MTNNQKHIIIDTDIGDDPDDLIAILLALASEELIIDLIVTSNEHRGDKARFITKVLKGLGFDNIPVVNGIDLTELMGIPNTNCQISNLISPNDPINYLKYKFGFVDAIKDVLERNEHTYYVCIGLQSNIADFLTAYPELSSKMEMIIMGGAINYRLPDKAQFNIRKDVNSTIKIFYFNIKKKYVISDTTTNEKVSVNRKHKLYKLIAESDLSNKKLLIDSIEEFFKKYPATRLHDPLTLSAILINPFVFFRMQKVIMNSKGIMSIEDKGIDTWISYLAYYTQFMRHIYKMLSKFNKRS